LHINGRTRREFAAREEDSNRRMVETLILRRPDHGRRFVFNIGGTIRYDLCLGDWGLAVLALVGVSPTTGIREYRMTTGKFGYFT